MNSNATLLVFARVLRAPVLLCCFNLLFDHFFALAIFGQPLQGPSITVTDPEFRINPVDDGFFGGELAAGDINGDGIDDLVVGAPSRQLVPPDFPLSPPLVVGKAYVFFGGPGSFNPVWVGIKNPLPEIGFSGPGGFGWSLAVGDYNADGLGDVLVGAPFAVLTGLRQGFVQLLQADGTGLRPVTVFEGFGPPAPGNPPVPNELFGWDVDFAAVPFGPFPAERIVISAPATEMPLPEPFQQQQPGLFPQGVVHVYTPTLFPLETTIFPPDQIAIESFIGGACIGQCINVTFGYEIATGDLVPGGNEEIFISDPGFDNALPPNDVGHVVMVQDPLRDKTELLAGDDDRQRLTWIPGGLQEPGGPTLIVDDFLGTGAEVPVAGSPLPGPENQGPRVYLFLGTASPPLVIAPHTVNAPFFGRSLASGDLGGDGNPDLIVSSLRLSGVPARIYIYTGPFDRKGPLIPAQTITEPSGPGRFGFSMTSGDFNGDGCADVAVGSPPALSGQVGRVYVYLGVPTLGIQRTGQTVTICWRCGSTNYVLESASNLISRNWIPVPDPVIVMNDRNCVTLDATGSARFFRLRKVPNS